MGFPLHTLFLSARQVGELVLGKTPRDTTSWLREHGVNDDDLVTCSRVGKLRCGKVVLSGRLAGRRRVFDAELQDVHHVRGEQFRREWGHVERDSLGDLNVVVGPCSCKISEFEAAALRESGGIEITPSGVVWHGAGRLTRRLF